MSWLRSHSQKITASDPLTVFLQNSACHLLLGCLWNESTLSTRCDHLPRHGTGGHSEKGALTLGAAERAPGAQRRLVKSGEGLLLGGEGELCPPGSRDANQ